MNSSHDKSSRLRLPIPLTSIEKFHLFDSEPDYPNLIFCRLMFDQEIDREKAATAWQSAMARQPLLKTTASRLNGKLYWDHNPRHESSSDFHFRYELLEGPPESWCVSGETTFPDHLSPYLLIRCWPAEANSQSWQSEFWIWGHHAVADGAAAVSFIIDWLTAYENLIADRQVTDGMRTIDQNLILRRNHLGLFRWKFLRYLPHQLVGLFGATKFIFRKTADPVDSGSADESRAERAVYPSLESAWVSADGLRLIRQEAEEFNVSLNSILMGELFRAISSWRLSKNESSGNKTALASDWIRLILPMNIRSVSDRRMPSANRSSIVQIDRCKLDSTPRESLYRSIDREVKVIQTWQLDRMFLIFMRGISSIEGWLKKAAANRKSRGFAVVTNLGAPFRSLERKSKAAIKANQGPTILSGISEFDFVGPIRSGTPFNFSFGIFDERLRITLHFDPRFFSREQSRQLLDLLVANLQPDSPKS